MRIIRREYVKKLIRAFRLLLCIISFCCVPSFATKADTIYDDNPYITVTEDEGAWTTCKGEKHAAEEIYPEGYEFSTGLTSSLRSLDVGEHYYYFARTGETPVGKWVVSHWPGSCVHDAYPTEGFLFHGINFGRSRCGQTYTEGWTAYCADCDEKIVNMLFYMCKDAADSIDYIAVGIGQKYYYLCPHCTNLEQGVDIPAHYCKLISWNQYRVEYDANSDGRIVYGTMQDSIHMYNNETIYRGETVTPATKLSPNRYKRTGYAFVGWNTEPDGSGIAYVDSAAVFNLTAYDYNEDNVRGKVTLYAQWEKAKSTLEIDPAGGTYPDPATGLANSDIISVTQEYGTKYVLNSDDVVAPAGNTVTFDVNGGMLYSYLTGNKLTGTKHFSEWEEVNGVGKTFNGSLRKNDVYTYTYAYNAYDGNVDRIRAIYESDAITLPEAVRENYSFGGWYYDEEFRRPAGAAGDAFIPTVDTTLYAQWVDLVLYSEDNYEDNAQKGAVNLMWKQQDNNSKVYKLYQSLDAEAWNLLSSELAVENELNVTESFTYTGSESVYTIPYTGLYTLTATGAQGGNYKIPEADESVMGGDNIRTGGLGGSVEGIFWLNKGDVITYSIGGQDGFGGGGAGNMYANGGGRTTVISGERGLLLVAGGGGGATNQSNGHDGGSSQSLRGDEVSEGKDGQAGGGAGYIGGTAGIEETVDEEIDLADYVYSYTYNSQNKGVKTFEAPYTGVYQLKVWGGQGGDGKCLCREDEFVVNATGANGGYATGKIELNKGDILYVCVGGAGGDYNGSGGYNGGGHGGKAGDTDTTGGGGGATHIATSLQGVKGLLKDYELYQDDVLIVAGGGGGSASYDYKSISGGLGGGTKGGFGKISGGLDSEPVNGATGGNQTEGGSTNYGNNGSFGKGGSATGKYAGGGGGGWYGGASGKLGGGGGGGSGYIGGVIDGSMKSGQKTGNGKATISLIEVTTSVYSPAYGGSNYVNTGICANYASVAGVQEGDGVFTIRSFDIGYFDEMYVDGIPAPDLVAPDAIQTEGINIKTGTAAVTYRIVDDDERKIRVIWTAPKDNGTTYYHQAESHMALTGTKLCTSNITENTLITGVAGYYFIVDMNEFTEVTVESGTYHDKTECWAETILKSEIQYLHVAPIDVAGNLGETSHIMLGSEEAPGGPIEWPVYTEQIDVGNGENVYQTGEYTWYVRCDNSTPVMLQYKAYMIGSASDSYQINQTIFESQPEGEESSWNIIETPMHPVTNATLETNGSELSFAYMGVPVLNNYPYNQTVRSNFNKDISVTSRFILGEEANGKEIRVTPRAGVVNAQYNVYSTGAEDLNNSVYLIGDCEAPVIGGMDELERFCVVDGDLNDEVIVTLTADDDGSGVGAFYAVLINKDNHITETITSADNVSLRLELAADRAVLNGDVTVEVHAIDNVGNERVESHDFTEFTMSVSVERLLAPHNPIFKGGESGVLSVAVTGYVDKLEIDFPGILDEYDCEIIYSVPQYVQNERMEFMIPLHAEAGADYVITVVAHKNNLRILEHPKLAVVEVGGSILDDIRTRLR